MTRVYDRPDAAQAAAAAATAHPRSRRTDSAGTVALAILVLMLAYACCSLLDDPRGTLGTDTGGKLATLQVMKERQSWSPDVGYWAESLDPSGSLHPLYYTHRVGDAWVNVTTLPMLLVAHPLYDLGGPRAVLVLPVLGASLPSLARALARRVSSSGAGWWAFWCVGLGRRWIYALDFWEVAPGVALVLWAIVCCWDLAHGRAGWRGALVAGLLFGIAATLRTEALVYAAVSVLVVAAMWLVRPVGGARRLSRMVTAGIAWIAGFASVLLANQVLERAIVGGGIRAGRATGTATAAGSGAGTRVEEALTTFVGLSRFDLHTDWLVGALIVMVVTYGAWRIADATRPEPALGVVSVAVAGTLMIMCSVRELGFVPGVLSASPLAVAGLVVGWTQRRWQMLGAIALVALPLVWLFQYSGGASPQWGGRYVLTTGTLLVVGGAVALSRTPGRARLALVAMGVLVTGLGLAWLHQRSHTVADAMRALPVAHDTVLVSRERHLLREGGAFYTPTGRWLTAESDQELIRAADVAREAGARRMEVVAFLGRSEPRELGSYQRVGYRRVEFVPGLDAVVVTYEQAGSGR